MAASKILFLAFKLLIKLNILDIYFYQQLLQVFILLLFGWVRIIAGKISFYSIYFTIIWLGKDNN